MAITYKILGQSLISNSTMTTLYTVPTGKQAIISSILVFTGDATTGYLRIHAVKSSETAGNVNKIYQLNSTTGSTNYSFDNKLTLAAGDFITIYDVTSGEASTAVSIFGTEMDV